MLVGRGRGARGVRFLGVAFRAQRRP